MESTVSCSMGLKALAAWACSGASSKAPQSLSSSLPLSPPSSSWLSKNPPSTWPWLVSSPIVSFVPTAAPPTCCGEENKGSGNVGAAGLAREGASRWLPSTDVASAVLKSSQSSSPCAPSACAPSACASWAGLEALSSLGPTELLANGSTSPLSPKDSCCCPSSYGVEEYTWDVSGGGEASKVPHSLASSSSFSHVAVAVLSAPRLRGTPGVGISGTTSETTEAGSEAVFGGCGVGRARAANASSIATSLS
mmetsp:Transcript_11929/g.22104  ORF Transcript_11929/g.22104 Transcript_11929/m.22104 type:complete len:251 (+) Transcript_11929:787-1539(+)